MPNNEVNHSDSTVEKTANDVFLACAIVFFIHFSILFAWGNSYRTSHPDLDYSRVNEYVTNHYYARDSDGTIQFTYNVAMLSPEPTAPYEMLAFSLGLMFTLLYLVNDPRFFKRYT